MTYPTRNPDRWWLAALIFFLLLAITGCVTAPATTEIVLVCVTDWEHGTSECHHRKCDLHADGTLDCFNKPVLD